MSSETANRYQSKKVTFAGSQGHELAARLDLPIGSPRAFALFAHCFTCSKDVHAASRISRALAERGFAVLRFDFTGLGASDGEFSNTNFSSNVADLVAAAHYLRDNWQAPALMIGHSLGGAAVLMAAGSCEEVKAVATIGAPADAAHVAQNFSADLDQIRQKGAAEVMLGGRTFTITKQFLDDMAGQSLEDHIARLHKALLIFHAPRDEIVGIDNATRIFVAAKHPKSFVSLDDADHLLSRRQDAIFVADMLAAWAQRYIPRNEQQDQLPPAPPPGVVRVADSGIGRFQQHIVVDGHRLIADEPENYGGLATGPSPYDFLGIALGSCTAMTLKMYADRKKLDLKHVQVDVSHKKVHADDCAACGEGHDGRIDLFERVLSLEGDLDEAQRQRLLQIADRCPVHRTLEKSSAIVTALATASDDRQA